MPSQHLLFAGMAPLSTVPDPLNQQTFRFHDTKSGDGGQWFYGKQSKLGGERLARGVERAWERSEKTKTLWVSKAQSAS